MLSLPTWCSTRKPVPRLSWATLATKSKHHPIRMTGLERAALYRIAMCTGFRANEIRHLTPECFDSTMWTTRSSYAKRLTQRMGRKRSN